MKRYSPGGKVYALPTDIAPTGVVFYNKKVFKEAGGPVPDPKKGWQWPEPFLSKCKKLVKRGRQRETRYVGLRRSLRAGRPALLLSNGGYFHRYSEEKPTRLALDSPQALQGYRFRWELATSTMFRPTATRSKRSISGMVADDVPHEQVAMLNSGIWQTPTFLMKKELEWDVVQFPKGPRGTVGWGSGGTGYPSPNSQEQGEGRGWW
jgi:ABC-type glycerol-3-phosphate transport system substrate-binding protein